MTETMSTSSTGGQKAVKAQRHSLVPRGSMALIAELYGEAAKTKYADHNWRNGYEFSKSIDSLQRHIDSFVERDDIDPEFGLPHLVHAAFHILALIEWAYVDPKRYQQFDDRYTAPGQQPNLYAGPAVEAERETAFRLDCLPSRGIDLGPVDLTNIQIAYANSCTPTLEETREAIRVVMSKIAARNKSQLKPLEFGVGDEVSFVTEAGSERSRLRRCMGGEWEFSYRGGPWSTNHGWTTPEINGQLLGRTDPRNPWFTDVKVVRQRRPWREGTSDTWMGGDRYNPGAVWFERRKDGWACADHSNCVRGVSDDEINERLRSQFADGWDVTLKLVDVTHDADYVKSLGG